MTRGPRIDIDTSALRWHAGRMDAIAADVSEATAAARTTTGFDAAQAFGLMCQFMTPPTLLVTEVTSRLIGSAQELLEQTADAVRASAEDFESAEQFFCDELRDLTRTVEHLRGGRA